MAARQLLGVAAMLWLAGCIPAEPPSTPGPPEPTEVARTYPLMGDPTDSEPPTASPSPSPLSTHAPTDSTAAPTATYHPTSQPTLPLPTPTPVPVTPTASPTPSHPPTPTADRACDPPLALSPDEAHVLPYQLLTFAPSGGTGDYIFELIEDGSGAIINEITGAYLSGVVEGATDRVRLSDAGCVGSAEAAITVLRALSLRPVGAEIAPGTHIDFVVEEGSGSWACSLVRADSGAQLTEGCAYTAGDGEGLDIVRVDDLLTGQHEESDILVADGARVEAIPGAIVVPVGHTFTVPVAGGTGDIDVELSDAGVEWVDGDLGWFTVRPTEVGVVTASVVDRFTGGRSEVVIQGVESVGVEAQRAGDQTMSGEALAPGDLDGDGFPDAILTLPEGDVGGYNAGAIYVYAGAADGLGAEPAQIFTGYEWESEQGRGVWVGDLDDDGEVDLVTGAYREDRGLTDVGVVRVHRGIPGGFFEEEASTELVGLESGAWFGYAVTACHLDDDGYMDLIVGAPRVEDDALDDTPGDAGALMIYKGSPYGFPLEPDGVLHGRVYDDGQWKGYTDLRMGVGLKSGDLNGDGRCDLVASAWQYDPSRGSNTGAVMVYFGRAPSADDPLGLGPNPDVLLDPAEGGGDGAHFGRRLALGDLNFDGADELLVSQWRYNDSVVGTYAGALRLYDGAGLATAGPVVSDIDADASIIGDDRTDYAGWVADITYLSTPDFTVPVVLVGDLYGEVEGGSSNRGRVVAYAVGNDLSDLNFAWEVSDDALASGEMFGQALAVLGDVNQDEVSDLLVLAGRASHYGYRVGTPYFVSAADKALTPLQMPGESAGSQLARGTVALVDLDGDGFKDLAAGAPYADPGGVTSNAGEVYVFKGAAGGMGTSPDSRLGGFINHGNGDLLGWAVAPAGDFDGDGRPDLAVAASGEDSPSSFDASYANRFECPGTRSNPGGLFIFRGQDGALPTGQPDFVYYGPIDSGQIQRVAGGVDFNGDGFDDAIVAQPGWDISITNGGGAAFVSGRANTPGLIDVICEADLVVTGTWDGEQAGMSIAGLGDLNGDGCDEVAMGAPFTDVNGLGNQGQVTVIFGWGGPGCPSSPEAVYLTSGISNAYLGYGIAGQVDIDGDTIPDMVAGAPNLDSAGDRPGGVFFVSGAAIAAAPRHVYVPGAAPAAYETLASVGVMTTLVGTTHAADFGEAVALIPAQGGGALAVIGAPEGGVAGVPITGGAWVYRLEVGAKGDVQAQLVAAMGGETDSALTLIGEAVAGAAEGGGAVIAVGGYRANGRGLDQGAVFVGSLR